MGSCRNKHYLRRNKSRRLVAAGEDDLRSKISQDLTQDSLAHPGIITNAAKQILPFSKSQPSLSQLVAMLALAVTDLISLSMALLVAFLARIYILPALTEAFSTKLPSAVIDHIWWVPPMGLSCLIYEGLYSRRLHFWQETRRLMKATTLAFLLMLAVISLGKMSNEVSRTILVLGYLISIILLPLGRLAGKAVSAHTGLGTQPVIILGLGKTGKLVAHFLIRERFLGYRIVGFLDDDPVKQTHGARIGDALFPVLGGFKDSEQVMRETGVRDLIVAAPGMPGRDMVELVNRLQGRAASVTVIPDLFGVPVMGVEADYSFDERILSFRILNRLANPWNIAAKRVFDLVIGSIILIVTLPIMLLVAVAIKLDSPGPIIFPHRRIGRNGKEFRCFKFRTMHLHSEEMLLEHLEKDPGARNEWEKYAKLKAHDPRVTRVGRLLRKFSLDELPQIFNVFKGEMSLVGPRPYLPRERLLLSNYADLILLSRPGMTGLWQVSGRNEIDFDGRLRLESWYVRNWSLWLDVTLLLRTAGVVLSRRGAY